MKVSSSQKQNFPSYNPSLYFLLCQQFLWQLSLENKIQINYKVVNKDGKTIFSLKGLYDQR